MVFLFVTSEKVNFSAIEIRREMTCVSDVDRAVGGDESGERGCESAVRTPHHALI
jgi:hypothetical protein